MPVRSLNSSVLTWPEAEAVRRAALAWAAARAAEHPELLGVACIGSLADNRFGPGSDLDLILVVETAPPDPAQRHRLWPIEILPVPVDLQVWTRPEWEAMDPDRRFTRVLRTQALWLWKRPGWEPWPVKLPSSTNHGEAEETPKG